MNEQVILVDLHDIEIGAMPKLEAHQKGVLHRAFSIFIFNKKGQLLLQQRADEKYHSGGLWTNTCCSHPRPGEKIIAAADRRLKEEMGIACKLKVLFSFTYKADLDNELFEHEFDHVLFGVSDQLPAINLNEVKDFKYLDLQYVKADIQKHPANYTEWLKCCFDRVCEEYLKTNFPHE